MDGLFVMPDQLLENGPARRIGKSTEHVIGIGQLHRQTITIWLLFVKRNVMQFPIAILRDINSVDWRAGGDTMDRFVTGFD